MKKVHVSVYASHFSTQAMKELTLLAPDHGSAIWIVIKRLGLLAWDHIDARDVRPGEAT